MIYSRPGAYFVTIHAFETGALFGRLTPDGVQLSEVGQIVRGCWEQAPRHFAHIRLDEYTIMPDHFHALIWIIEMEAGPAAPVSNGPIGTAPGSLGAVIQNFKSVSTRKINHARRQPGGKVWQRNYYERVIRGEAELNQVRQYIQMNPQRYRG